MGEFDLITRYFTRPAKRAVLGVGDDCALWQVQPGMQLAVSSDMLVEGRHFLNTVPPKRLGHKALAVNLSDLAASGGCKVFRQACWHSPINTIANWWAATPHMVR
jgi:thiamine-monophosphate kinase